MLDVKRAVKAASDHLRSLYDDVRDIRLEEVIAPGMRAKDNFWSVTLSFENFPGREYKKFELDPGDGTVRAMRMVKV